MPYHGPLILAALSFRQVPALATLLFLSPLPPRFLLSPFPSIACALFNSLVALFQLSVVCFQCFAHSLCKTPGGMGSPLSLNPIHEDQNDTKPSQFRFHSRAMPASHFHRSPMPLRCSRTE